MSQHDNSQFFKNWTFNAFLGLLTQQKHHNIFLHYLLKEIRLLAAVLFTKNLIFCRVSTWYWPNRSIHGMRIKLIDYSTAIQLCDHEDKCIVLDIFPSLSCQVQNLPPWRQSFDWLIWSQTTRIWSVWTLLSLSIIGTTEKQIN